jgi:hypothetical protein
MTRKTVGGTAPSKAREDAVLSKLLELNVPIAKKGPIFSAPPQSELLNRGAKTLGFW